MIRRVAFAKASLPGVSGAVAWEALARALLLAGVPWFDLVQVLGTMLLGRSPISRWWPLGMAIHLVAGAIWAVFYAYFIWSSLDWPPVFQGIAFSLGPTLLAGLVMVPQIDVMHPLVLDGEMRAMRVFARGWGWGGPVGLVTGHLAFGAVMGALYTRPVGRAVRRGIPAHG